MWYFCLTHRLPERPHSPNDGRFFRVGPKPAVLYQVAIGAPAVPDSLSTVVEVPLADAPRDGVGLCASLLGQDGDDLPRAGLGAIESLGDEDDPAADLLKLIGGSSQLVPCRAA